MLKIVKTSSSIMYFLFFWEGKTETKNFCKSWFFSSAILFIEYYYLGLKIFNFKQTQFFVNYLAVFSIFQYLKQFHNIAENDLARCKLKDINSFTKKYNCQPNFLIWFKISMWLKWSNFTRINTLFL